MKTYNKQHFIVCVGVCVRFNCIVSIGLEICVMVMSRVYLSGGLLWIDDQVY